MGGGKVWSEFMIYLPYGSGTLCKRISRRTDSEKQSLGAQTRIRILSEDQSWKASCCATQPVVLILIGDKDNRWKPTHQPNGPANRKVFGREWRVSWAKSTGLTVCTLIYIF